MIFENTVMNAAQKKLCAKQCMTGNVPGEDLAAPDAGVSSCSAATRVHAETAALTGRLELARWMWIVLTRWLHHGVFWLLCSICSGQDGRQPKGTKGCVKVSELAMDGWLAEWFVCLQEVGDGLAAMTLTTGRMELEHNNELHGTNRNHGHAHSSCCSE